MFISIYVTVYIKFKFTYFRRDNKEENKVNVVQRRNSIQQQKHGSKDKIHKIITVNPIDNNKAKLRKKKFTKKILKKKYVRQSFILNVMLSILIKNYAY